LLDLLFEVQLFFENGDGGGGVFEVAHSFGAGTAPSIVEEANDLRVVGIVAGVFNQLFESEVVDLPTLLVEEGVIDVVRAKPGVNSGEDTSSKVESDWEGGGVRHS